MGLSTPSMSTSTSTSNRRVAPLPSLTSSNNNNTIIGRTTRSRSRAGTIAQFSASTSLSSNNASVPSLPTVPPSPSTYVPMQPLTPTRMSAELVVVPQTPHHPYCNNPLSKSLAGSKRKTSEIEEEEDGGHLLSRSTRRRGNSTIADLVGQSKQQGSPTPVRTAIGPRIALQGTPSRRSQANNLFSSLPASLSAPSHSGSFTTSTVGNEQIRPVPSISYISAAGARYAQLQRQMQQQRPLNMSMPASAPCMEFSISAPPHFDGAHSTTSSYFQQQPGGELFSIPDPNQLYAPHLSHLHSYGGQSSPSDYFHSSSSSASAIRGAFEEDAALSAYGASYPASAPAAYFDINTTLFDGFVPHTLGSGGDNGNGEGIWPPPPTAFPISAGPVFGGGQDKGWSTSTEAEMTWNGGGANAGGQQGAPLQALATLLPDFLPSPSSGQQKQRHHGRQQDELENSATSRPIDGVQAIPSTPIKTGSSAASGEVKKSDDLNERMALFASQVRRQAEKLTLADGEEQDETRSDGSEYQDEQDVVESPSKKKRSGGRTQRQWNGSSQTTTKERIAVSVDTAGINTPQTVGKTNDEFKVKTDNRKTHSMRSLILLFFPYLSFPRTKLIRSLLSSPFFSFSSSSGFWKSLSATIVHAHKDKPPESGIPRPRNAWILFRSAVFAEMKASLSKGTQQRVISRLIAGKLCFASFPIPSKKKRTQRADVEV